MELLRGAVRQPLTRLNAELPCDQQERGASTGKGLCLSVQSRRGNSPKVEATPECMWYVPVVDNCLDIKSYDTLTSATAWVNRESLNLSKGSQTHRPAYGAFVFL